MSSRALQALPRLARAASTSTGGATLERVFCTGRIRVTGPDPQLHKIFFSPVSARAQPILAKPPGNQVRDCDGELILPTSTFSSVKQPIVWSAGRSSGFDPIKHERIVSAAHNGMFSVAAMVNKQTRVVESFTYSHADFSAIQKASKA